MTSFTTCAATISVAFALAVSVANPTFAKPARTHATTGETAVPDTASTATTANWSNGPGIQHETMPGGEHRCWVDTDGAGRPFGYFKSC